MPELFSIFGDFVFTAAIISIIPLAFHFTRKSPPRWRKYWIFVSILYVFLWMRSLYLMHLSNGEGLESVVVGTLVLIPVAYLTLILIIGSIVSVLARMFHNPTPSHSEKHIPQLHTLKWMTTVFITFAPLILLIISFFPLSIYVFFPFTESLDYQSLELFQSQIKSITSVLNLRIIGWLAFVSALPFISLRLTKGAKKIWRFFWLLITLIYFALHIVLIYVISLPGVDGLGGLGFAFVFSIPLGILKLIIIGGAVYWLSRHPIQPFTHIIPHSSWLNKKIPGNNTVWLILIFTLLFLIPGLIYLAF